MGRVGREVPYWPSSDCTCVPVDGFYIKGDAVQWCDLALDKPGSIQSMGLDQKLDSHQEKLL